MIMIYAKNISRLLSLLLVIFLGGILIAHAGEFTYTPLAKLPIGEGGTIPEKYTSMGTYLAGMLKLIIALGGVFAIVTAIIGGVQRIASGISPSGKEAANDRIENALIGLGLVLTSYLILNSINPKLVDINSDLEKLPGKTRGVVTATSTKGTINPADCPNTFGLEFYTAEWGGMPDYIERCKEERVSAVEVLNLSGRAKEAALFLKKKYPYIVFTSGKRNIMDQARVMAKNIIDTRDRRWIEKTYKSDSAKKLQEWVNNNPRATTAQDIKNGLYSIMYAMTPSELASISKHLSGNAFDVEPLSPSNKSYKNMLETMRRFPGGLFIENESGVPVWHLQF